MTVRFVSVKAMEILDSRGRPTVSVQATSRMGGTGSNWR